LGLKTDLQNLSTEYVTDFIMQYHQTMVTMPTSDNKNLSSWSCSIDWQSAEDKWWV